MDILFEIKTASGKIIRTTSSHWELISKLKHPEVNGDGFIITAYITDRIKEGETVWRK